MPDNQIVPRQPGDIEPQQPNHTIIPRQPDSLDTQRQQQEWYWQQPLYLPPYWQQQTWYPPPPMYWYPVAPPPVAPVRESTRTVRFLVGFIAGLIGSSIVGTVLLCLLL
jgi:hypothetical protein